MNLPETQDLRVVLVVRKTPLELLLERHGTFSQAQFYLKSRGQDISDYEESHARLQAGFDAVVRSLPSDFRRVRVFRDELDRFLFSREDVVFMVGQDGLVANVAKYLEGQPAAGINPDPERYDGVLCQHAPSAVPALLNWLLHRKGDFTFQERSMARALREDGQLLLALNEIFVGHRTHQSAKYTLEVSGQQERHSSSGLICATGTGATGWAKSISRQRGIESLPAPEAQQLAWFVREPFPSVWTGTNLEFGYLNSGEELRLHSHMGEDGVLFADGIESDRVEFISGQSVRISLAQQRLRLIVPQEEKPPPTHTTNAKQTRTARS